MPCKLEVGTIFTVPFYETRGYGYGYISLVHEEYGYFSNIYDRIGDTDEFPKDLDGGKIAIRNLLHTSAQFKQSRFIQKPWIVSTNKTEKILTLEESRFIVGSIVEDILTGETFPASQADKSKYVQIKYPFGNRDSFFIEAKLRRRELCFDENIRQFYLGVSTD